MMKNALKSLSFLMVLGTLVFISSCGSDDGGGIIIDDDDEGSFVVADGLYIAGISSTDTTVVTGNKLSAVNVEDEGFGTKERSGHFATFTYLEAGTFLFLEVEDQEAADAFGGATTEYNDDEADNTDDYAGGYTVVDLSGAASSFSVASSGFYHVIFDTQTDEALLVKISSWGAIGGAVFSDACSSDGFNADIDLNEVSASAADGAVYLGEGIILKNGEFKVRYNDSWKIDRRTDKSSYDDANGYVVLTNLGGTPSALEEGGANISLADNSIENGIYDITFSIDDTGSAEVSLAKTGEAPECEFDPANYPWGIIGGGTQGTETTAGWSDDKDLIYDAGASTGGTHIWKGVFPISDAADNNMFKFRTDDTWATKLIPTNVTFTDNTEAGTLTNDGDTNGDGQWFVESGNAGFFYITISTTDQGATWNLMVDEAEFQVIGAGSPVGNWDAGNGEAMTYNDDLASWSYSGDFTGEWKVFVNQSFDYNLGGALDGTTALLFNNSAFNLTATGANITLSTADGGVTYTALSE